MTQFLVTIDDDQYNLSKPDDLMSMIVSDWPTTAAFNRPRSVAVAVQSLTPEIVAELAPEVTTTDTILPWRVKHKGVTVAALTVMPTRDQFQALADGDALTDITIHFEIGAI